MWGKDAFGPSLAGACGLALALTLAGCTPAQDQQPTPTATSPAVQPPTPAATSTPAAPPIPSMVPSASDRIPEPSADQSAATTPGARETTSPLTIFYVAVGDGGKSGPRIGCGDSIVATETAPETFTDKVRASMEELLADKSARHGESGLMNALAPSDLSFVSASVSGDTVTVDLTGTVSSGGTCDDPRIIEQLTHTATVAAGVGEAKIVVDGIPISKILSEK